MVLILYLML